MKSLQKATFIAQNYAELWTAENNPNDSLGLLSFVQWEEMFSGYLIQMYNGVLQSLDLRLDVVYPIDYIAKSIPLESKFRQQILAICREKILRGDDWHVYVNYSLFYHPREIARNLFMHALSEIEEKFEEYQQVEADYLKRMQDLRHTATLNKISEDELSKDLQNIESLICLAK